MHCCDDMVYGLEEARSIIYRPECREYGVRILDGGSSYKTIYFCPWCGSQFPPSLFEEWIAELEKLDLDAFSPDIPAHLQDDTWWRQAE